jgi:hypothetical protein
MFSSDLPNNWGGGITWINTCGSRSIVSRFAKVSAEDKASPY